MKIEIEKNIEIPNKQWGIDYSFIDTMEISDSFKYPTKKRMSFMQAMKRYSQKKELGFEFTSRIIQSDNENVRIWRVK